MPFDDYVNECGVSGLLNSMGIPAVTEEYTKDGIFNWYALFREQYVTTGIWDAQSVEDWCSGFINRVSPMLLNIRHANPSYYKPRIMIMANLAIYGGVIPLRENLALGLFSAGFLVAPTKAG
jgi:hypothetical protein